MNSSDKSTALMTGSSDFEVFSNITGILQDKFPNIEFGDIPGLDGKDGGDGVSTPRTYFAIFMCSLIFSIFWITYITFLNSRVVGSILTRLANSKFTWDFGGHIEVRPPFFKRLYLPEKPESVLFPQPGAGITPFLVLFQTF